MMNRFRNTLLPTCLVLTTGIWSVCVPRTAHAQAPSLRFGGVNSKRVGAAPYQQRLSPYLDLLRTDNSALSPYHSFVQPRQQFRQTQSRQAAQIRGLDQMVPRSTGTPVYSDRIQTGRGGMFNNYLHYYQFSPTAVR